MGLRVKIDGSESINLSETSITKVDFGADIPHDSNARSTDLGSTVLIIGKFWRQLMERRLMIPVK